MKIEIDLEKIFDDLDEDGRPQGSLRDVIIVAVVDKLCRSNQTNINNKISSMIEERVKALLYPALDKAIDSLLDYEFVETSRYGSTKQPTTVRARILEDMEKTLVWRDGNYDSDKSPYTKAIQRVVQVKLDEYAKQFQKEIDKKFIAESFDYATKKLREKLGIKE
jgi:hypothetical protein